MLISKYADDVPLCRQSQIFECEYLDLDRSAPVDWAGNATILLKPLAGAIGNVQEL